MNNAQKIILGVGALGLFWAYKKKLSRNCFIAIIGGVAFLFYVFKDKTIAIPMRGNAYIPSLDKDIPWEEMNLKEKEIYLNEVIYPFEELTREEADTLFVFKSIYQNVYFPIKRRRRNEFSDEEWKDKLKQIRAEAKRQFYEFYKDEADRMWKIKAVAMTKANRNRLHLKPLSHKIKEHNKQLARLMDFSKRKRREEGARPQEEIKKELEEKNTPEIIQLIEERKKYPNRSKEYYKIQNRINKLRAGRNVVDHDELAQIEKKESKDPILVRLKSERDKYKTKSPEYNNIQSQIHRHRLNVKKFEKGEISEIPSPFEKTKNQKLDEELNDPVLNELKRERAKYKKKDPEYALFTGRIMQRRKVLTRPPKKLPIRESDTQEIIELIKERSEFKRKDPEYLKLSDKISYLRKKQKRGK